MRLLVILSITVVLTLAGCKSKPIQEQATTTPTATPTIDTTLYFSEVTALGTNITQAEANTFAEALKTAGAKVDDNSPAVTLAKDPKYGKHGQYIANTWIPNGGGPVGAVGYDQGEQGHAKSLAIVAGYLVNNYKGRLKPVGQ